jgi:hypothetical protein
MFIIEKNNDFILYIHTYFEKRERKKKKKKLKT